MDPQDCQKICRFIIDESVSTAQWLRFQAYAREHFIPGGETYWVKERHPGMPDRLILHQLMDVDSVLITTDRPLHNQVVELRLRSFHVGPEHCYMSLDSAGLDYGGSPEPGPGQRRVDARRVAGSSAFALK